MQDLQPEAATEDQPLPWDAWDNFIEQYLADGAAHAAKYKDDTTVIAGPASRTGDDSGGQGDTKTTPASRRGCGSVTLASRHGEVIPKMPTTPYVPQHRPKLRPRLPVNACVARPVTRKEVRSNPKAREVMKAEWDRLRKMGTWDELVVREWRDVAREARQSGQEVHFGYLLGLCFEKGSELPDGHPDRKYKGGTVFQGDRVVNQN